MSLYNVLNLRPGCTMVEIKKNYHKLAKMYHPDKSSDPNSKEKFQEINYAYEILSNDETRKTYNIMNNLERTNFEKFLNKLFKNKLKINELENLGIKLSKKDFQYLDSNFNNLFNKLNLPELFSFFTTGVFPKNYDREINQCSDSEVDVWNNDQAEYYSNLPLSCQKLKNENINLELEISLEDILLKKQRKIKLSRKIDTETIYTTFIFNLTSPYIVFEGGGDIKNNIGNLIIKLNLPEFFSWNENLITYNHYMSLYEMIYGLKLNIDLGFKKINIQSYTPSRDGYILYFDDININNNKLGIKFLLNYNHTDDKERILKEFFN
jgi:hypothetical protein